jgi:hypothetical protein
MSQQILVNSQTLKFVENPFSRSRVVTCVQADGQTDRGTYFNCRTTWLRMHLKILRWYTEGSLILYEIKYSLYRPMGSDGRPDISCTKC